MYKSRFLPLKGFVHAIQLLFKKEDESLPGQISHFQAFCNSIAATVGLGNISGVAVAIATGGPGALLWMWIAAWFGMNTKFFECTAAHIHRGKDYKNEIQGGAMYTIEKVLPSKFRWLSIMFAVCGLIGTLSLFQINQVSHFLDTYYEVDKYITGILFSILIGIILIGGLKSITSFCAKIVPIMSVFYFVSAMTILIINYDYIPSAIMEIFYGAFNPQAIWGGVLGHSIWRILVIGMKRATFSNEAGIGTAPMAHSNSKTNEPISEGYVSMLGPFLDTIIICTLTALVILVSFRGNIPELSGINLTAMAFEKSIGEMGRHFLGVTIVLFALSTMIGMANYNIKCWDYLFKGKYFFTDKTFVMFYAGSILVGALIKMDDVVNIMDIFFALMTIPNGIITIILATEVTKLMKDYNKRRYESR